LSSFTQPGRLDPSFGNNGILNLNLGLKIIEPFTIESNNLREIFIGGTQLDNDIGPIPTIIKLHPDGSIDASFADSGLYELKHILDPDYWERSLDAIAIQDDNKILLSGKVEIDNGYYQYICRLLPNGTLDLSFAEAGISLSVFPISQYPDEYYSNTQVKSIHILPDGKILSVLDGYYWIGYYETYNAILFNRMLPDGKKDSIFGKNGVKEIEAGSGYSGPVDILNTIEINAQENTIYIYYKSTDGLRLLKTNLDIEPDTNYGNFGSVSIPGFGYNYFYFGRLAFNSPLIVIPDGSIILGSSEYVDENNITYQVVKVNSDGFVDNNFSNEGILKILIDSSHLFNGKSLQYVADQDEIVLTGTLEGYNDAFELQEGKLRRYIISTNGTEIFPFDITPYNDSVYGIALTPPSRQTDNSNIMAGLIYEYPPPGIPMLIVIKINSYGEPDEIFYNLGIRQIIDLPKNGSEIRKIISNNDGDIYYSGYKKISYVETPLLGKLSHTGSTDSTFGKSGVNNDSLPGKFTRTYDMELANNKLYLAGDSDFNSFYDYKKPFLARYNLDGYPDKEYGEKGILPVPEYIENSSVFSVKVLSNQYVIAGGVKGGNPYILRVTDNGTIDNSFGISGFTQLDGEIGEIHDLIVQSDQQIIAAGNSTDLSIDRDFMLFRIFSDGNLDYDYGDNGKLTINMGTPNDISQLIAQYSDGKILVGGAVGKNTGLARIFPDGEIDNSFGVNGRIYISAGDITGIGDLKLLPDNKIILALTAKKGTYYNLALAMLKQKGEPDSTFGENGFIFISEDTKNLIAQSISITPEGDILLAGTIANNPNNLSSIIVKITGGITLGMIDNNLNQINYSVYPHPIRSIFTLEYELLQPRELTLQLFDLQGRLLNTLLNQTLSPAGKNKIPISLDENLASGTYLLKMNYSGDSLGKTLQIIKQ